ncbi:flagellar basal body rod protein FlgB [soil metagenome]
MDLSRTDNITDLLQSYLDVQTKRSQVIAGNIANADTPGFVAQELKFDDFLRDAAEKSSLPARDMRMNSLNSQMTVVDQEAGAIGIDGNTVDPGREMAELAQAGSSFNFGAKMLQSRLRLLRTAIREGK